MRDQRQRVVLGDGRVPAETRSGARGHREALRGSSRQTPDRCSEFVFMGGRADPRRILEQFVVGSWDEHLRQHERVSRRDEHRLTEIADMTDPRRPPTITHWLRTTRTTRPDESRASADVNRQLRPPTTSSAGGTLRSRAAGAQTTLNAPPFADAIRHAWTRGRRFSRTAATMWHPTLPPDVAEAGHTRSRSRTGLPYARNHEWGLGPSVRKHLLVAKTRA